MRVILPTRPSLGSACSATMMPASVPETPTPMLPWAFMASTSCWFTSPVSTMRTRSMAASVVTRWPSTNSTGRSNLAKARLMALPPPWTSTGFTPRIFKSTMSAMTSAASWGFSMAEPPYLMTMVLPVTCLSHGMAS